MKKPMPGGRWLGAWVAGAVLLAALPGAGAADEVLPAKVRDLGELLAGIEEQKALDLPVAQDRLQRGVAAGWWSEKNRRDAGEQLAVVFSEEPLPEFVRAAAQRFEFIESAFLRRIEFLLEVNAPTNPVLLELHARRIALNALRAELRPALRNATLEFADALWINARRASDLAPAIRAIWDLRALSPSQWNFADNMRRNRNFSGSFFTIPGPNTPRPPDTGFHNEELLEAYDVWAVLASPEPFLLSDPAADPAGFLRMHEDWLLLQQLGHRFTRRPAVAAHVRRQVVRFTEAFEAARERLQAAFLRDAPARELAPLFKALNAFLPQFQPRFANAPRSPQPPAPPMPPLPGASRPPADYRTFFTSAPRPGPARGLPLPPNGYADAALYGLWLRWVEACESAEPARVLETRKALEAGIGPASGPLIDHLRARLAQSEPAPAKPAAAAKPVAPAPAIVPGPVEALLAAFQSLEGRKSLGPANFARLQEAWQRARDAAPQPEAQPGENVADLWRLVALQPDGRLFLRLREEAARVLLHAPASDADTPIAALIGARLESALADGAWKEAARLLELDAAGAFQPASGHQAFWQALDWLQKAADLAAAGRPKEARAIYANCIAQTALPEVGKTAAQALKRLK